LPHAEEEEEEVVEVERGIEAVAEAAEDEID